ncbi:MAG: cytochrome c biogenesis protein CcdA [candidate division WOR-3 bacterium]
MQEIPSLISAFIGGIFSFISPCVLPLVPIYISYISGISLEELQKGGKLLNVFLNSLFFVLGFTIVFVFYGASATFIGAMISQYKYILSKIGGIIIIIFGIHLTGLFRLKFLDFERRINVKSKSASYIGSFIMGFAFSFGWTPCIGPILAAILVLAAQKETLFQGTFLLFIYSMGLGIPFILSGIFINYFFKAFSKIKKHFRKIEIIAGILLILLGILVFFDIIQILSQFLPQINVG